MMTRRKLGATALAFSAALLLAGCGDDRFPDYSYKMTIYADGKAFSSVRHIEVTEGSTIQDSSGRRVDYKLQGQAVILDLPDGRTVYALLCKPDKAEYATLIAGAALMPHVARDAPLSPADQAMKEAREEQSPPKPYTNQAEALQMMVKVKGPKDLTRFVPNPDLYRGPRRLDHWPMFVTFSDPKDPKTVREVSPESIGVDRITIEITDEPVTTGIEERLGWLDHLERFRKDPNNVFTSTLPSEIAGLRAMEKAQ